MLAVVSGRAQNKDKDKNGADRTATIGGTGQDRLTREVRHELVMLPYYGVFDVPESCSARILACVRTAG